MRVVQCLYRMLHKLFLWFTGSFLRPGDESGQLGREKEERVRDAFRWTREVCNGKFVAVPQGIWCINGGGGGDNWEDYK